MSNRKRQNGVLSWQSNLLYTVMRFEALTAGLDTLDSIESGSFLKTFDD